MTAEISLHPAPRAWLFAQALFLSLLAGSMGIEAAPDEAERIFAKVNGEPILLATYYAALRTGGRERFYHGRPPEAEVMAFRKEVGNRLVEERLLHQEAVRRGIRPDRTWVESELAELTRRYARSPGWDAERERVLPLLRRGLEERSRIRQLEERLRRVGPPKEAELRRYYRANPESFTSPDRNRVSIILLKVPPWAEQSVWEEKQAQARNIAGELEAGADFARLARRYSEDGSAANGGDMGYLHQGMLGPQAERVLAKLQPGERSEPVVLLEGVALFRLEERVPPRLNPFSKVRDRAQALWLREAGERAREKAISGLRSKASIRFTDPLYYRKTPSRRISGAAGRARGPSPAAS
mgnify:FL=1